MKKLASILMLLIATINLLGQNKSIFSKYPFSFIEDSLLYYHYDTKGSNPFHLKFNKKQTSEVLNLLNMPLSGSQITYIIKDVQIYKLNSPTNKNSIVTFMVSTSLLEIYVNNKLTKHIKLEPIIPKQTELINVEEKTPTLEELMKNPVSSSISLYSSLNDNSNIREIIFNSNKSVTLNTYFSKDIVLNESDIIPFINYLVKYYNLNQKLVKENMILDFSRNIDSVIIGDKYYFGTFTYSANITNRRNKYSFITLSVPTEVIGVNEIIKDFYYKIDGDKIRPTTIKEYLTYKFISHDDYMISIDAIKYIIEILTVKRDAYYNYIKMYNEKMSEQSRAENEIVDKYFK